MPTLAHRWSYCLQLWGELDLELRGAANEIFGKIFLGFLHLFSGPLEGLWEMKHILAFWLQNYNDMYTENPLEDGALHLLLSNDQTSV